MKIEEASLAAEGRSDLEKSPERREGAANSFSLLSPRCSTGEKSGMKAIRGLLRNAAWTGEEREKDEGRERGSYSKLLADLSRKYIFLSDFHRSKREMQ